jgi:hypothetical protein
MLQNIVLSNDQIQFLRKNYDNKLVFQKMVNDIIFIFELSFTNTKFNIIIYELKTNKFYKNYSNKKLQNCLNLIANY